MTVFDQGLSLQSLTSGSAATGQNQLFAPAIWAGHMPTTLQTVAGQFVPSACMPMSAKLAAASLVSSEVHRDMAINVRRCKLPRAVCVALRFVSFFAEYGSSLFFAEYGQCMLTDTDKV